MQTNHPAEARNFIEEFIIEDLANGKNDGRVQTRFPPEPNGYLHIGHAKAICINFGIAEKFGGKCNLRFDDTNPVKEDTEFVDAIEDDIRWLGFSWNGPVRYCSDYFDDCYRFALDLIKKDKAYVCDLTPQEVKAHRGTLTQPGKNSPFRERSVEENLELFEGMKAGKFAAGTRSLRAKIDMASPNINMRDPVIYRIMFAHHHRTGDKWCIYPTYDYSHPIGDALENVTHSLCSLEFEAHRPLYDWVTHELGFAQPPRQIEFAKLNLTNTIMGKRFLRTLVERGMVSGWDDPRMPTLCGLRRRGVPAAAIRDLIGRAGVAKADSTSDIQLLDFCIREELGHTAPRLMGVLDPLKIILTNWPEDKIEQLEVENHPEHPEWGTREVSFGRELYIEQEDFMENPPGKFFRLAPGREVRLKSAYIIRCDEVVKDDEGNILHLLCSADLESKSGQEGAARKVKGTLHWVHARDAISAAVRLYDHMVKEDEEEETTEEIAGEDVQETPQAKVDAMLATFNRDSIKVLEGCKLEPAAQNAKPGDTFQFLRMGYFTLDKDSTPGAPIFTRTVSLKDSWQKAANKRG